jgi:hypothetical protein
MGTLSFQSATQGPYRKETRFNQRTDKISPGAG